MEIMTMSRRVSYAFATRSTSNISSNWHRKLSFPRYVSSAVKSNQKGNANQPPSTPYKVRLGPHKGKTLDELPHEYLIKKFLFAWPYSGNAKRTAGIEHYLSQHPEMSIYTNRFWDWRDSPTFPAGEYRLMSGKYIGKLLSEVPENYVTRVLIPSLRRAKTDGEQTHGHKWLEDAIEKFLEENPEVRARIGKPRKPRKKKPLPIYEEEIRLGPPYWNKELLLSEGPPIAQRIEWRIITWRLESGFTSKEQFREELDRWGKGKWEPMWHRTCAWARPGEPVLRSAMCRYSKCPKCTPWTVLRPFLFPHGDLDVG